MIRNSTSKRLSRIVTFAKIVSSVKRIAILVSVLFLAGTIEAIYSQAPPSCPTSASSIPAEFRPQNLGDSTTVTIDLAPCETVEVHESHDMGGDGNRGTILKVSYLNASGQELAARTIYGFDSATDNTFPLSTSYDEPFPWVGVRAPVVLPLTLKIESTSLYGQGNPPSPPLYTFTIIKTPRPGYNVGGYDFASAPLVPSLPTTYKGSLRQGVAFDCTTNCTGSPPQSPPDPGQYFKVHLCVGQTIYVYGTAKENTYYGGHFTAEIYNSAQQYLIPLVNVDVWAGHDGTFTSNPFTNPNATDADFYIRVWSRNWAIQDFQLTIDSYVASNNQSNPRPIAPDATGSGGGVSSEEYHLPAAIDSDVLTIQQTEIWAKVYWPTAFSGGPYPLVVFLHGNHSTCGRIGTSPRVDDNSGYTLTGICPAGYSVVQNHLGYEYLASQLASRGYIVASINANRGITAGDSSHLDDPLHIFSRGRLVLKHLETLSKWNSGPTALITPNTLGTLRHNSNNWFGMKITVGPQPITVHALGRIFVSGNTGTHTVKLVRASDSVDLASVSIPMSGGTAGQFKYVNLTTPIRLAANTSYYVASKEVNNGDYWYDSNTIVSSTSVATVNGRVSSTNGTTWTTSGAVAGRIYVPVDLKYQVLSENFAGKIDFANVGLMGHSRGGQGVLAAYNLYRNPSIDPRATPPDVVWSTRIPGMNIKGIFEIGPTDFVLPTVSDGSGSQYLNGDSVVWNVLLPMCDGDVTSLEGVRVFDRSLRINSESPATQKSTYTVWGANHNFYNTEWQDSDPSDIPGVGRPPSPCIGSGNTPLFTYPTPAGNSSGSLQQQQTALASLLALFRGNVGSSISPSFNQNFDPRYDLASVVTGITRVDRGYTTSPHTSVTTVIQDFDQVLNNDYCSTSGVCGSGVTAITAEIPHQDYPDVIVQTAALVSWGSSGCDQYFQINASNNVNLSGYQTLDLRLSRQPLNPLNPATRTSFSIRLVTATGLSNPVSLYKYSDLIGPVGGYVSSNVGGSWSWIQDYRPILQGVRIPLTDFTGANLDLTRVQGIQFVFSDTQTGAIYVANVRASH